MKLKNILHQLIMERLLPNESSMDEEEISNWLIKMPAIFESMRTAMRTAVFSGTPMKLVCRHMNQCRKEWTVLLDQLYHYPEFSEKMLPIYLKIADGLELILEHQERFYGRYLDQSEIMPILLYRKAGERIERQVNPLVSAMNNFYIDKTLQALVVGKMTMLLKEESGSWHQINYLGKLQKWIFELCKGSPRNLNVSMKVLLYRANFNTIGFIAYCKTEMNQHLAKQFDVSGKRDALFGYKREFEQLIHEDKSVKFERMRPDLKEILLGYVNVEMSGMNSHLDTYKPIVNAPVVKDAERLPLAISADAFAYLFKLLVKVGVVGAIGRRPMLTFLARSFQTAGIGDNSLSALSLDTKYRQVLNTTAVAVKSILLKMLKQVDEEF
jgi:hypothetical protein